MIRFINSVTSFSNCNITKTGLFNKSDQGSQTDDFDTSGSSNASKLPSSSKPPFTMKTDVDNTTMLPAVVGNDSSINFTNSLCSNAYKTDDLTIEILWSVTVAIFVLFGMLGSTFSGQIANTFGRKKGLMMITVLMLMAGVLGGIPVLIGSFEVIIIHRAIVGLHSGISLSIISLYLAEISPTKIRGSVISCNPLLVTIGILWSEIIGVKQIIGRNDIWPWGFAFNAFPAVIFIICIQCCPESPRFLLINKGLKEEARTALIKLRGHTDVQKEIDEMIAEDENTSGNETFTIKRIISSKELRKPLLIALLLFVVQQLSGINAVMSYSSFMYENAGVPDDVTDWVVCGTGVINVLGNIANIPLMEKLGRRPLILFSTTGMAVAFIVLTIFHTLQYYDSLKDFRSTFAVISIIAMHMFVVSFSVGLGPVPFAVTCEMFQQECRATALSFALTINWLCNFTLVLVFRFMQKGLQSYVYIPFIVILILSTFLMYIVVPETKNRSFEEITNTLKSEENGEINKTAYINEGFEVIDTRL